MSSFTTKINKPIRSKKFRSSSWKERYDQEVDKIVSWNNWGIGDWQKQLRRPLDNLKYKPRNKVYDHKIKMTLKNYKNKENMPMSINQKSKRNGLLVLNQPNPTTISNIKTK